MRQAVDGEIEPKGGSTTDIVISLCLVFRRLQDTDLITITATVHDKLFMDQQGAARWTVL